MDKCAYEDYGNMYDLTSGGARDCTIPGVSSPFELFRKYCYASLNIKTNLGWLPYSGAFPTASTRRTDRHRSRMTC